MAKPPSRSAQRGAVSSAESRVRYSSWRALKRYSSRISSAVLWCKVRMRTVSVTVVVAGSSSFSLEASVPESVVSEAAATSASSAPLLSDAEAVRVSESLSVIAAAVISAAASAVVSTTGVFSTSRVCVSTSHVTSFISHIISRSLSRLSSSRTATGAPFSAPLVRAAKTARTSCQAMAQLPSLEVISRRSWGWSASISSSRFWYSPLSWAMASARLMPSPAGSAAKKTPKPEPTTSAIMQMITMTSTATLPPAAIASTCVWATSHRALRPDMTASAIFWAVRLAVAPAACAACLARCTVLAARVCASAALDASLLAAEAVLGSGAGCGNAFRRVVT